MAQFFFCWSAVQYITAPVYYYIHTLIAKVRISCTCQMHFGCNNNSRMRPHARAPAQSQLCAGGGVGAVPTDVDEGAALRLNGMGGGWGGCGDGVCLV